MCAQNSPSQNDMSENSWPTSFSSSTTRASEPPSANSSAQNSNDSASLIRCSPATLTPLPPQSPSALTTYISGGSDLKKRAHSSSVRATRYLGHAPMPLLISRFRVNALLDSSCASFCLGPTHLTPIAQSASDTPASSGPSGPTTAIVILCARANSATAAPSVIFPVLKLSHTVLMPGLLLAAKQLSEAQRCDSFSLRAIACSRAFEPTTRKWCCDPVASSRSVAEGTIWFDD
mmetsp:Transcript_28859/g.72478  ORF Transcript_28859/g.72478 Transcript_28859/m.72478 type:complete len:233 (-) Transcript_28859:16-714(-)